MSPPRSSRSQSVLSPAALSPAALSPAALSYDEAKELARHHDVGVRRSLAQREDVQPEILYFLAEDPSPEVRRALAANQSTPARANLVLAHDADEAVRGDLAGKIARIAPQLSQSDRARIQQATHDALEVLARDQFTRVRQVLAETLKDMADAPPDVVRRLARDVELVVCGPVLEASPILTDDDLVEIIGSGPVKGALGAISRRRGVSASVSDAIVATDDVEAVADLLGNPSAQIREETLDMIIDRAPSIDLWHAPLVGRPRLPRGAAQRLAEFVTENLLAVLERRTDMDPATLEAVKSMVRRRVGGGSPASVAAAAPAPANRDHHAAIMRIAPPVTVARRLHESGHLDPKVIAKAIHACDNSFVLAAIAVRADLGIKVVQTIFAERNAKGVVAACWKAGLPSRLMVPIQQRVAGIPPTAVVTPLADGGFPMGDDEMAWQLDFFAKMARHG